MLRKNKAIPFSQSPNPIFDFAQLKNFHGLYDKTEVQNFNPIPKPDFEFHDILSIIASYPQHFAAEGDEQVAWMQDYLSKHDWFAKGIYLTDEWVESESELFSLLEDAGLSETSDPPRFEVVAP